jgi:hypothetical protein
VPEPAWLPSCKKVTKAVGFLDHTLQEINVVRLALAIALGWSLFQVASGVSDAVSTLLIDPTDDLILRATRLSEPLTWEVGGRIVLLGPLLRGLIELALVIAVAVALDRVRRNRLANPSS